MLQTSKIIDLSFGAVEIFENYKTFSHHITLSADKRYSIWYLAIHDDLCIGGIEINWLNSTLSIRTNEYSIMEIISEIYNTFLPDKYPNYTPEKWLDGNFVKEVTKDYPKAFVSYNLASKISKELSEKYGINMRPVIDRDGYTCTKIEWSISEEDVKSLQILIKKGLDAMREYCTKATGLPYNEEIVAIKEDPLNLIFTWLNVWREVYNLFLKNNNLEPIHTTLTNYSFSVSGKPYMTIEYPYKNTDNFTITITKEDSKYTLEYTFPKDKKIFPILEENLRKDNFNIEITQLSRIYRNNFETLGDLLDYIKAKSHLMK